ncbi:hypothetical protein IFM89_023437 [Coptis chinensis]|uniref:SHSP domain-containing protein n=1 Tax=Coptis chinensis TaxID=261450 RepID=A0A835IWR3_9MAGN|nr:hypothetical protein IFM89_023437 [Coptis chinensis]
MQLLGFQREELKVRVDTMRKVTVSGERLVSESKYSRFKQVYDMPEDSDVDSITGRFDGGLLFIIIPKKKTEGVLAPKTEIQRANEIEEEKPAGKKDGDYHKHQKEDERHVPKNDDKDRHEKKEEKHVPKKDDHGKQDNMNKEEPKKDTKDKHDDRSDIHGEKKEESKTNDTKVGLAVEKGKKMMEEDWTKLAERVKNREDLEILRKRTLEKIRNNKTVIITAVVAFSIGLFISRKF